MLGTVTKKTVKDPSRHFKNANYYIILPTYFRNYLIISTNLLGGCDQGLQCAYRCWRAERCCFWDAVLLTPPLAAYACVSLAHSKAQQSNFQRWGKGKNKH